MCGGRGAVVGVVVGAGSEGRVRFRDPTLMGHCAFVARVRTCALCYNMYLKDILLDESATEEAVLYKWTLGANKSCRGTLYSYL